MDVTIDIKTFFIVLVLIAMVVLIVYAIFVMRKLLVTLDHTNTVLEDVEVITEIAAARSEDLDGIVDNVSVAANELSESMSGTSLIGTVSSVAKSAASIRGLFQENDPETRAAKKGEKRAARSRKRKED